MAKLVIGLGLVISLAIFAIAMSGAPASIGAVRSTPAQRAAQPCNVEEFALDEGYGVSRTVLRRSCAE